MSKASNAATLRQFASILGVSGVSLGAIGAHALKDTLEKRKMTASYHTATLYLLVHATAVLGVSALSASQPRNVGLLRAGQAMTAGTVMFSGSIYCLCFGIGPKMIMGPTTPLGGLCMIAGWALLGLA